MAQAKMILPITKEVRENDNSRFWKTDYVNLDDILRNVGSNVQFSIWNKPDDYDESDAQVMIEINLPYKNKTADAPYTYKNKSGNDVVYIGLWERSGTNKKGQSYTILSSSSIDIGRVHSILGSHVVMYISKAREKKSDRSPDYGCYIMAKTSGNKNNNYQQNNNQSNRSTQGKSDIPF